MEPFISHKGLVAPIDRANVDMDQIISKQSLKRIEKEGYAPGLFYNWRYTYDNELREDFVLNDPKYDSASILLARENFGCGSSWEHAVWALLDYGFKVVIAPTIADIFYYNSMNMGLLALSLSPDDIDQLFKWAETSSLTLEVDLNQQTVKKSGEDWYRSFQIDSYNKDALLHGIGKRDQIDITLKTLAMV